MFLTSSSTCNDLAESKIKPDIIVIIANDLDHRRRSDWIVGSNQRGGDKEEGNQNCGMKPSKILDLTLQYDRRKYNIDDDDDDELDL